MARRLCPALLVIEDSYPRKQIKVGTEFVVVNFGKKPHKIVGDKLIGCGPAENFNLPFLILHSY